MYLINIPSKPFQKAYILLIASFSLLISSCTTNPATGKKEFTPFLPQSSEKDIGASEHRKIVNQFGGEYKNTKLKNYVQKVTNRVTTASEHKSDYYTVTILNTPIVNAFALPGGYLYVTRGLLTVANTEAELAAVLGHEAAHVTARHAANRSTVHGIGQIGAMLLGASTKSREATQLAKLGLQGVVASYSRSDEYEADEIGVRYLSKAGYNPYAQADFLHNLRIYSDFKSSQNGGKNNVPSFFSTHPDTKDRVARAASIAKVKKPNSNFNGRMNHLKAINGMIWGDDPKQGYVRDNLFIHPELRFEFKVPSGFNLQNGSSAAQAQNKNGAIVIFDIDPKATNRNMSEYLKYEFAQNQAVSSLKKIKLKNVKDAATAISKVNTNRGGMNAKLYALRGYDNKVYRFIMIAPNNIFNNIQKDFSYIVSNFRTLTKSQASRIKPFYVRYRNIRRGDSFASLAKIMSIKKDSQGLLRAINGFDVGDKLPKSGRIKLILNR